MSGRLYPVAKRLLDVTIAFVGLVVLSPLLGIITLTILIWDGRPILFLQRRPGYLGQPFNIIKFRTMQDIRDAQGNLLSDEKRLTSLGRFLRATSLDELPELVNVLKGEMSLVGPRPLLMQYLVLYTPEQRRRHEVRPGITGWAQVHGRNILSWEEKFQMDVWYVDNGSLWLELRILAQTASMLLTRKGISQQGQATAKKFEG